jgi:transposase
MGKFNADDKLAAVQRYLEGVDSYRTIGASISASENMIRTWVMQYEHHGVEVFTKSYNSCNGTTTASKVVSNNFTK